MTNINKSSAVNEAAQSAKVEYKGVELVDSKGKALGEIDRIEGKLFVEDKSAHGLSTKNPRTGLPYQTPEAWAKKQIFGKTVTRIENLAKSANTRTTVGGSPNVPPLSELKNVRSLEFRIESSTPQLQKAVEVELNNLKLQYPDWTFTVKYGK